MDSVSQRKKKKKRGAPKELHEKTPLYAYRVDFTDLPLLHTTVEQNKITETCCLDTLTTAHPHLVTYPTLHQADFAPLCSFQGCTRS